VGSKLETAVGGAGRGMEGGDWVVGEGGTRPDPSATFHLFTEAESLQSEKKKEKKKKKKEKEKGKRKKERKGKN